MRTDVAWRLLNGRAALSRRQRAAASATPPADDGPGGIGWDRAVDRFDGTRTVPVRGLDGLQDFLRSQGK